MPRITITPEDSLFCASFFHKLHTIETPNFSSLQYYDRVVKDVFPVVYCATDREASCLGIFLKTTFEPLKRWRFDKYLFEKEAASKPGFSVAIGSPARCSYDQYCTVFFKWFDKITKIALHCLDQYQDHGRACLLVLIKLDGVYPARRRVNALLMDKLDIIRKQEDMKDVQAMAQRYHTLLNKRKDSLFDDVVSKREAPFAKTQNSIIPSKRQPNSAARQASPDKTKASLAVPSPAGKTGPTEAIASTMPSSVISLKYDTDSSMRIPPGQKSTSTASVKGDSHVKEHISSPTSGSAEASSNVLMRSNPNAVVQPKLQDGAQSRPIRASSTTDCDSKSTKHGASRSGRSNRDDLEIATSSHHRNRGDAPMHVRTAEHPIDRCKYSDNARPIASSSTSHLVKSSAATRRLESKRIRPNSAQNQSDADRPIPKRSREEERRRGGRR
mmetsp:Transcript_21751/g.71988  ORF Transcript_21751/g.71988 Transcript_21751/m.71988 type:complete len:443 (+) Transcript_21751:3070-4398(+)